MSTFYLLPPRPLIGERLAGFLRGMFPGVVWDNVAQSDLADSLGYLVESKGDRFVIFREDLPPGESASRALTNGYGAEAGDEVVEVRPEGNGMDLSARRWQI